MEKQNINLVTSLPARQSIYMSFSFIKLVFAAFLGVLIVIYLMASLVDFYRLSKLNEFKKERTTLNAKITSAMDKMEKTGKNSAVLKDIAILESKIQERERFIRVFRAQKQRLFSVYLETIANLIPDNVWLTQIHIVPDREFIALSGKTLDAGALSGFVKNLKEKDIFNSFKFKSVDVGDTKENLFQFVFISKDDKKSKI